MRTALVIAVLLAAGCRDETKRRAQPDDYGTVPAFALHDQTGARLDQEWLRGHVTIVDFVFTRCDTICPLLTLKMARLDEQLADVPAVRLLSFSVDPKYDTPEVLAAYAATYKVDPARWRFVTGEYDQVLRLVEGALMTAMDDVGTTASGAPDIRHGGHFLLVGPDLKIRGVYDSSEDARLEALAADARALATRQKL